MECTRCGADRAQESRFCSNCGSALATAGSGTQVGHASLNPENGRNVRHVLLGILGGLWLGLAFIGALLVFVPRGRRNDRLFGAWIGSGLLLALVMTVVALLSLSDNGEAPAESVSAAGAQQPIQSATVELTAPEVMTAVRTIHPDYCIHPPDDVTDSGNQRSFRYNLTGPQQQTDGRWFVNCMTATTVWWDGVPLTVVQHRCKAIDPDSLTVTDVETGDTLTKDERTNTTTFGVSCLE